MTIITAIDYALMAGASYISNRALINQFPVPNGWLGTKHESSPLGGSGFEAISFINGADIATSTNIVISYAGTNPADITGDVAADLSLAAGHGSAQLLQAAEYYLQVKMANPTANISFTGHSLGGGLASLMSVFFNLPAVTFDQAPFLNSATNILVAQNLESDLRKYNATTGGMDATSFANFIAPLDAYITASDPTNTNKIVADTLAGRQGQVTNINVQGEFLSSWYGVPSSNRIGSQTVIPDSSTGVGGIDLHSQALLTAFLQSNQTAVISNQTLSDATVNLPDLLKMIFDPKLFAYLADLNNTNDNRGQTTFSARI